MSSYEWIYGVNPVIEAIRAGRNIKKIFVLSHSHETVTLRIKSEAEKRGIPVENADSHFFESRFPKGHQRVAAMVSQKGVADLETLLMEMSKDNRTPLFVILDGIEDPHNFGAILRSADAAGVDGVVIQHYRSVGLGAGTSKASAGAVEYVPVAVVPNIKHAISKMKEKGITVIGAEAGAYPYIWEADLTSPLAVVIGSEGKGLRRTVKENCDILVSLPMRGKINSLNVSVAAGIILFEILRQRALKNEYPGDLIR